MSSTRLHLKIQIHAHHFCTGHHTLYKLLCYFNIITRRSYIEFFENKVYIVYSYKSFFYFQVFKVQNNS